MEIDSFTSNDMSCYASNAYFADFIGISQRTVRKSLTKLEELGMISRSEFDGNRRYLKSLPVWQKMPNNAEQKGSIYGETCHSTRHAVPQIKKEDKTSNKTNVVLPWEGREFKEIWEMWKSDRSQRKIKKYTELGEQTALAKLHKDSGGDMQVALEAIKSSIANGYQGIFVNKKSKPKPTFDSQKFDEWLDS